MDSFPDLDSIASSDEQNQLFGLGNQDDRRALLEQQLAQAQALKNHRTASNYTNPAAAGFAGIGDIINAIKGGGQEKDQLAALKGLSADKQKALQLYMQLGQRHAPDGTTDLLTAQANALRGGGAMPAGQDAGGFNAYPGAQPVTTGPDSRAMQPQASAACPTCGSPMGAGPGMGPE